MLKQTTIPQPVNPNVALLKQRPRALILFLALLSAAPALTTDMYLPALANIAEGWGVSVSRVNLSLVLWFVAFSFGLFFCGIFSDRIGRRPIAIGGVALFVCASVLCAFAKNVDQLIAYRIFQGFAAAAPSAMCLAICRDCYEGKERQRALAWIGIILLLAPMLAPTIGSLILQWGSWQAIFLMIAVLGILMIVALVLFYRETVAVRETGPLMTLFAAYGRLAHNRNYAMATVIMSLAIAPGFAFVGFSTIVYMQIYDVGTTTFAILFGVNALSLMLGALLCTRLIGFYPSDKLITVGLVGGTTAGVLLLFLGGLGYPVFAGLMALYSFSFGITRPLANSLILDQVNRDIGTASSMLILIQFVSGAIAMAVATAPWKHPLLVFGLMVSVIPAGVLATWPSIRRRLYGSKKNRKVDADSDQDAEPEPLSEDNAERAPSA